MTIKVRKPRTAESRAERRARVAQRMAAAETVSVEQVAADEGVSAGTIMRDMRAVKLGDYYATTGELDNASQ